MGQGGTGIGATVGFAVAAAVVCVVALALGSFAAFVVVQTGSPWWGAALIAAYVPLLWLIRSRVRAVGEKDVSFLWWLDTIARAALLAAGAMGAFAGITALSIADREPAVRPALDKGDTAVDTVWPAYEHYAWKVADSIPVVELPATFNWKPKYSITDTRNNVLTLAAKILLILPFLEVAAAALRRRTSRTRGEPNEPTYPSIGAKPDRISEPG
jgi:hypothetical protein